jgi:DNA-directed RNA polymerase sigma subunit (sigma70/sigma32)
MTDEQLLAQAKQSLTDYHQRRDPAYKKELGMKMLRLHRENGLTYAQIGKRFGVTKQRVQQLIKELITK